MIRVQPKLDRQDAGVRLTPIPIRESGERKTNRQDAKESKGKMILQPLLSSFLASLASWQFVRAASGDPKWRETGHIALRDQSLDRDALLAVIHGCDTAMPVEA